VFEFADEEKGGMTYSLRASDYPSQRNK